MVAKPKSTVKSKTAIKPKAAVKPNKKISSRQSDFSHLAEDIISNISVGIYIVQNGKFVYVSPLFQKLSGYSYADLAGTNPLDYLHPDDREAVRKKAIKSLKKETTASYEYRFIRKNGKVMWVLEMATSIIYKGDRAALASLMDITERKLLEEKTRQSEERYRAILENMQEGYYENDLAGNYTFVNDTFCRSIGYPREELLGMNYRQFENETSAKKTYQAFNEIYRTEEPIKTLELEYIRKDGTKLTYELSASLLRDAHDKPIGFGGVSHDITKRKRSEEALRESEEKYRTILDNIEEGYYEVDLAGNFTFFNDSTCRLFGYTREESMGMNYRQYTDEYTAKKVLQAFNEVYRTEKPKAIYDYEIIRKDGTKHYIAASISLRKDAASKIIGFRGIMRDITITKEAEEELRRREEKMQSIFRLAPTGIGVLINRIFVEVNSRMCEMTGYSREELIGFSARLLYPTQEDFDYAGTEKYRQIAEQGTSSVETRWRKKDGAIINVLLSSTPLDLSELSRGVTFTALDISERKQAEKELRKSEEKYRHLVEDAQEGVYQTTPEGRYLTVNPALVRMLGYDSPEEVMQTITDIAKQLYVNQDDRKKLLEMVNEKGSVANFETELYKKDGGRRWVSMNIHAVRDDQGRILYYQGINQDISERKRMQEELQHQATHDALTGLPNRMMFSQLLKHAIQSAQRHKRQLAVFFIDLDRFKTINDTLGHEAGDQLLQEIALRFKQSLRAVDVVGRLGGDEFVILIEEVIDFSQVATVAHKILTTSIKPIVLLREECHITASIGISIYPKDGEDEQSLMKNADSAMYLAKEEGKNNYQFYSKDIQLKVLERQSIETNLRFALERNELSLHYQAKVDFKTNTITGVEALLRWQNPFLGSVTPTQFIPVAEASGLIIPIGMWVMRTACAQNVAWQQQGLPPVCMAVNLSLRQLTDENLIEDIKTALNDSGMAPNLLELEITESMVMHNPTRMSAVLAKIKNLGVRLALDNFGTGYSSLAQIKHFPVDTLKVDRSFIRNIPKDAEDKAITKTIIAMGKTLGLTVVAEGVETVEQMNFLKDHSCDEMQGYYFSKPIIPEQFADLLRKHVPSPRK